MVADGDGCQRTDMDPTQQLRVKIRKHDRQIAFADTEEVDDLIADRSYPGTTRRVSAGCLATGGNPRLKRDGGLIPSGQARV